MINQEFKIIDVFFKSSVVISFKVISIDASQIDITFSFAGNGSMWELQLVLLGRQKKVQEKKV